MASLSVFLSGCRLGAGFGLTGYCPVTGLACAAAGRIDALITLLGMLLGALVFILIYPSVAEPLDAVMNAGKLTLPEWSGVSRRIFH